MWVVGSLPTLVDFGRICHTFVSDDCVFELIILAKINYSPVPPHPSSLFGYGSKAIGTGLKWYFLWSYAPGQVLWSAACKSPCLVDFYSGAHRRYSYLRRDLCVRDSQVLCAHVPSRFERCDRCSSVYFFFREKNGRHRMRSGVAGEGQPVRMDRKVTTYNGWNAVILPVVHSSPE